MQERVPRTPRSPPGQPTLSEVIRDAINSRLLDVHTAIPGVVVKYDKLKQVADVQPVINGVIGNNEGGLFLEELPILPNVPVGWMRGAGASLQMRLAPGDHVFLIFSEAATALWRSTGTISEPGDLARHDLSYAMALPCIAPDADALAAVAGNEGAVIDTAGADFIRMGGASADFVALAAKVDAALSALATFCHAVQLTLTGGVTTVSGGAGTFTVPLAATSPTPAPTGTSKLKGE